MEPTEVRGMQPSLSRFSGDPADGPAEDFVAEVDRVLAAYPMTPEMAAHFIIRRLKGAARTEVMLHNWEETNTPQKVTSILTRVFGDKRRLTTLLSTFFSRSQQPTESILDYSHAVRSLEVSIKRKDRDALSDNIIRDKFVDGLSCVVLRKEMRHFVGRHPHTTFLEARDEAILLFRELEEEAEQRHYQQITSEETLELETELLLLREEALTLAETLETLESSQIEIAEESQGKRKRKRRRRRSKKHVHDDSQVSTDTSSNSRTDRDLNHNGCPQQPSQVSTSTHTNHSSDEEEESCYSGWVLLPIPQDAGMSHTTHSSQAPGKSSRGQTQRFPATDEAKQVLRSPRQQDVGRSRIPVSHSKRIVPGCDTQTKHTKHLHRRREIKWA